jgi:hypothetical protein
MKIKYGLMVVGSFFVLNSANAGSVEITNCSLSEFSYSYNVENGEAGIIQVGSIHDDTISLSPSTVGAGAGADEYDLSDEMPDGNIYVTLIDGDEITTRLCSEPEPEPSSE